MTMVLPMSALYPHTQTNCTFGTICESVPVKASSEYGHCLCTCKRSGANCICVWQTRKQSVRLLSGDTLAVDDGLLSPATVGRNFANISANSCVPHFDDDPEGELRVGDPPHQLSPGRPTDGDTQILANISSSPSILLSSVESRAQRGHVGQKGCKRKLHHLDDDEVTTNNDLNKKHAKRISPFLNTPKQRKEERRKIFRISAQKFRTIEDPELFLRRSVLIRNTIRKIQDEIRDEKRSSRQFSPYASLMRTKSYWECDALNTNYLAQTPAYLFDEPQVSGNEKLEDDRTDVLVSRIEQSSNPVPSEILSDCDTVSCDSLREKHILREMDAVFNNLICVLGET